MGTGASFICKSNRWRQTVGVWEEGERRWGSDRTENNEIQMKSQWKRRCETQQAAPWLNYPKVSQSAIEAAWVGAGILFPLFYIFNLKSGNKMETFCLNVDEW